MEEIKEVIHRSVLLDSTPSLKNVYKILNSLSDELFVSMFQNSFNFTVLCELYSFASQNDAHSSNPWHYQIAVKRDQTHIITISSTSNRNITLALKLIAN